MSYRKDREKILKTSPEDFDQYFDYFFEKLLNIRRAICLNDYSILNDSYFESEPFFNTLCTPEEVEYFSKKPRTIVGAQEYYNLYLEKIDRSPVYVGIGKTLDEAIMEDGKGFPKGNAQAEPLVSVSIETQQIVEAPQQVPAVYMSKEEKEQTERILSGNYNDVVSAPVNENSKAYKEGRRHIPKLFRYYLKCLVEHTMNNLSKEEQTILDKCIKSISTEYRAGRNKLNMSDIIFYFVDQINEDLSNDKYEGVIPSIFQDGYTTKPSTSSPMIKYRKLESTSMILKRMIEHASRPFNRYEHIFAVDSTGMRCVSKNDYYADKHHKKKEQDWCDLHAMCGTKSNIITSAEVKHKYKTDETIEVIPLIERTRINFIIDYVLGDGGYLDRKSMDKAYSMYKVKIYAPIKTNTVINPTNSNFVWDDNIKANLSDEWEKFYHKRSNIETSFFALKKTSGETVNHSRNENTRINEVYCKVVIYNINKLIVYLELAEIKPDWKELDFSVIDALLKDKKYSDIVGKKED